MTQRAGELQLSSGCAPPSPNGAPELNAERLDRIKSGTPRLAQNAPWVLIQVKLVRTKVSILYKASKANEPWPNGSPFPYKRGLR